MFFVFKTGLLIGQNYEFTLSSTYPLDVYVTGGENSDPNEFAFDAAFRQQNYVKFSYDQYPSFATFTAAVKLNGIDYYQNKFNQPSFQAKFIVSSNDNTQNV